MSFLPQWYLVWHPACTDFCSSLGTASKFSETIQEHASSILDHGHAIVRPHPVAVVNTTATDINPIRSLRITLFVRSFFKVGNVLVSKALIENILIRLFTRVNTAMIVLFILLFIEIGPDKFTQSAITLLVHFFEERISHEICLRYPKVSK